MTVISLSSLPNWHKRLHAILYLSLLQYRPLKKRRLPYPADNALSNQLHLSLKL